MKIREIHIDKFGIWGDKEIKKISPGLNIVYGKNEFGKTTLLEFVRWVLFGFARKRNGNQYNLNEGGVLSGKLICESSDKKRIILSRAGNTLAGKVKVNIEDKEIEGQEAVNEILGNASRKVFENIYAFTLDELQKFDSLLEDEIKSKIYGAGLGLGPISLNSVTEKLLQEQKSLFSVRGHSHKPQINQIFNEIKILEIRKKEVQKSLERFDLLESDMIRYTNQSAKLEKEYLELVSQKRRYENQQNLFQDFVELESSENELKKLEPLNGLPENGYKEFEKMQMEVKSLQNRIEEELQDSEKLKTQKQQIHINKNLLRMENEILQLQPLGELLKNSAADKLVMKLEYEGLTQDIDFEIKQLGEKWNLEKVKEFYLNESDKDFIKNQEEDFETIRQKLVSLQNKLDLHYDHIAAEKARSAQIPSNAKIMAIVLMSLGVFGLIGAAIRMDLFLMIISFGILGLGGWLFNWIQQNHNQFFKEDTIELRLKKQMELIEKIKIDKLNTWEEWLEHKGLDQKATPRIVKDIVIAIREIQGKLSQRLSVQQRRDRFQETENQAQKLVDNISQVVSTFSPGEDLTVNISQALQIFQEERKNSERINSFKDQLVEKKIKIDKLEQQKLKLQSDVMALIHKTGAKSIDDFLAKYKVLEHRNSLQQKINVKQKIIQSNVGVDEAYSNFIETLKACELDTIKDQYLKARSRLEQIEKKREECHQKIGETRKEIQQLTEENSLLEIQTQMEMKKSELQKSAKKWAVSTLALHFLDQAKKKYEKNRQPVVIQEAQEFFSIITEGVYRSIVKPMDEEDLIIENTKAETKRLAEMSRGTKEQLYLAMRLGLIKEYERRSEPLPILMDDVFVNFDDDRRQQLAKALKKFSKKRQIIVLTCHQNTLDLYIQHGAKQLAI